MRRVVCACAAALAGMVGLTAAAQAGVTAVTAPAGYKIVKGTVSSAPQSMLETGDDTLCPSGTVAWGGGVAFQGNAEAGESIGTSDPAGSAGWNALVDNTSGAAQSFTVDAICAKQPKGYTTVSTSAANPAGAQTAASVNCPAGTVVLSAGILSQSDSSSVEMTSLWPAAATKVTGKMLNQSGAASTVQVKAVCGAKPAKYSIVKLAVTQPAHSLLKGGPKCPAGTSVLGGGINIASPGKNRNVSGSSDGGSGGWSLMDDNTAAGSVKITLYAICAA
jgi:hypothetical protein